MSAELGDSRLAHEPPSLSYSMMSLKKGKQQTLAHCSQLQKDVVMGIFKNYWYFQFA